MGGGPISPLAARSALSRDRAPRSGIRERTPRPPRLFDNFRSATTTITHSRTLGGSSGIAPQFASRSVSLKTSRCSPQTALEKGPLAISRAKKRDPCVELCSGWTRQSNASRTLRFRRGNSDSLQIAKLAQSALEFDAQRCRVVAHTEASWAETDRYGRCDGGTDPHLSGHLAASHREAARDLARERPGHRLPSLASATHCPLPRLRSTREAAL